MYKNNIAFFFLFFALVITIQAKAQAIRGKWNGNVGMVQVGTGITGSSTLRLDATIVDNVVTATMSFDGDLKIGNETSHISCMGAGPGVLNHLDLDRADSVFYIHVIGTDFTCNPKDAGTGTDAVDITITDKVNGNFNYLHGSRTDITEIPNTAKVTTTYTWNLHQGPVDAELIITPIDYDSWLPKPGLDELLKGAVMDIRLKVQGRNGSRSTLKAVRFELTLSATSVEPGMTINFPVSPRAKQLPDLRLLPASIAESIEDDQFLSISCDDGATGKVCIGSYDGGGWTTLTAEAVLEDSSRIRGHLLVSGGETDIRIPKRDFGSKIATAWLNANKNPVTNAKPGEMDDKEETHGNKNKGDGLTAYEEYRGVISLDTFRRLSPKKKELGVLLKRSEYNTFKLGLNRFENASDIKIYVFGQYEIPDNRRLNQNAKSAHDFKQYVLRLSKGNIRGETDIYGLQISAWGVAYRGPGIPARVTHIAIDVDAITTWYQGALRAYGARNLPFTDKDLVASTTAHEIGHAVNLPHHGLEIPYLPDFEAVSNPPRIFNADATGSWEIFDRPYKIDRGIASPGDNQSGNVSCFMCYRNKVDWVRIIDNNNVLIYYRIPWLAAGSLFCTDKTGTGINANKKYFGDGFNGNCLGNIKLRD